MKQLQDEFTHLPISREKKRQLRKLKRGLCRYGACQEPLATKVFCLKHAIETREYQRSKTCKTGRRNRTLTYRLEAERKKKRQRLKAAAKLSKASPKSSKG